MSDITPVRRALLSVTDKSGLIPFARGLADAGIELISTGGTAAAIRDAGLNVTSIEQVTGLPEMLDGRVKTLHPAVHGGILARRDRPQHLRALEEHGFATIDLVCVNLYAFERTLHEDLTDAEAIELIDIGGPAMIRSAGKNHASVAVVTSPEQYEEVLGELRNHGGVTPELRRSLAAAAFTRTAEYDTTVSNWISGRADSFQRTLLPNCEYKRTLRYGENPHQRAALYLDRGRCAGSVVAADMLHGKPLSYNNLNDAAAAFELARELRLAFPDQAGAVVVKHTNPCGAAVDPDPASAFIHAHSGDPLAAYGGILACNTPIAAAVADHICEGNKFFEVIVAPGFEDDSVQRLSERWKNVRLLATGMLDEEAGLGLEYRSLPGGALVQTRDTALPDTPSWTRAAGPEPDADVLRSAAHAWLVAKHLKSNAVAIGAHCRLLGAGAGQMDRVAAARIAVEKARDRMAEMAPIVAASDGFFPFDDGPRVLADAGVSVIVQPGGSKRDADTVALCESRGMTLLMTGIRHFKH